MSSAVESGSMLHDKDYSAFEQNYNYRGHGVWTVKPESDETEVFIIDERFIEYIESQGKELLLYPWQKLILRLVLRNWLR